MSSTDAGASFEAALLTRLEERFDDALQSCGAHELLTVAGEALFYGRTGINDGGDAHASRALIRLAAEATRRAFDEIKSNHPNSFKEG